MTRQLFLFILLHTVLANYAITHKVFLHFTVDNEELGGVLLGLYGDIAPYTALNFKGIATGKFTSKATGAALSYKGSEIYRVVPDFIIIGGDITRGDGTGNESIYGKEFEDETFKVKHDRPGILSMYNKGPNTNGSQFIITMAPIPWIDGKNVAFGEVIEGMEVLRVVESLGTKTGKPKKSIRVKECGLVS